MKEPGLYSVGQFSKITGLSIKTLRFYHEKGILVPARVDAGSGYRYYDPAAVERARVVSALRSLEFSIEEIAAILRECGDEADALAFLERRKEALLERMRKERGMVRALDRIISGEREARRLAEGASPDVEERTLPPVLMAGMRLRGKYSDCGKGFARVARAVGRHIAGKPFCLYYDDEYREDDADLEACFPVRKPATAEGISVRELPGCRCLALVHHGPYELLGRSYARALAEANRRGLELLLPTREVYRKGPGMIFRGDPRRYLTEIQLPFAGLLQN